MGKRLVHDYEFNADSNKITFNEILSQDRFLLITNVTDGEGIFAFNDRNAGISNISFDYDQTKTTITLQKDTSAMADSNKLQVFIEDDATVVEFAETYTDPVSKIRVSQPENLIDTDFEYGLQSTKWETLELVKNIPTFFSRNGDISLNVTSMATRNGSDLVTVTCADAHNLSRGTPILVQGTTSNLANGGFVVTAVQNDTTFEYKSKGFATSSSDITETYTQVFVANIYQGTEFDLQSISAVTTDENESSKIMVRTQFPTNFNTNTSFFLTNSFAKASLNFSGDSTQVDPVNAAIITKTSQVNNVATGENNDWAYGMVQPFAWKPVNTLSASALGFACTHAIFVNEEDYEIRLFGGRYSELYFPNGHGVPMSSSNSSAYVVALRYQPGANATGLSNFVPNSIGNTTLNVSNASYWARIYDANTIRLFTRFNSTNTGYLASAHNNAGRSNGNTKSCFYITLTGYLSNSAYTTYWHSFVDNNQFGTTNVAAVRQIFANANVERWATFLDYWTLFGRYWPADTSPITDKNPQFLYMDLPGTQRRGYLHYNYQGALSSTIGVNNNWQLFRIANSPTDTYQRTTRSRSTDASPDSEPAWQYMQFAPMERSETGNSFYIQNHGFSEGAEITITALAGTLPTGVNQNGTYTVRYINENRFGLRSAAGGNDINFTDGGSLDLQIQVTGFTVNENNDTIRIANNTFSNGDPVKYNNNGATNIPGLTDDTTYYIYDKAGDFFKLATTPTGLDSAQIIVDQNSSVSDPRIDTVTGNIFSSNNNFSSGNIIKATQLTGPAQSGITSGNYYFINKAGNLITLYYTDSDRVNSINQLSFTRPTAAGTFKLQRTTMVDITGVDSGTHNLIANFVGAADGVYNLDSSYESNGIPIFTLRNSGQVLRRTQSISLEQDIDLNLNAINLQNHGYITGNSLLYEQASGTVLGNIDNNNTYYTKRISKDWFRLASTEAQALDSENAYITFDSSGNGSVVLTGTSIVGETPGIGSIDISSGDNIVRGTDTAFTSLFRAGDRFDIYVSPKIKTLSGAWNTTTDIFTADSNLDSISSSLYTDGISVIPTGVVGGLTDSNRYYASQLTDNTYKLHNTVAEAIAGTNAVDITSAGSLPTIALQLNAGKTIEGTIDYVNSPNILQLTENVDSDISNAKYSVRSKLLVRADGFALHRPYDGGVELIPSTNPDSKMIRQTRKYFRYQSGKGIQVSFAVNFKPTVDIESLTRADSVATITTRDPHRINITDSSDNVNIVIKNANNGNDYWNGNHRVISASDYSFNVKLDGVPSDQFATGRPEYYVDNWNNCSLRCGLFDDQNGLFYEFNGSELLCCIRSATKQISGTSSVQFKSGAVFGTNTKFTQQLTVGESIVIKGQTYIITRIPSDVQLNILPSYRGTAAENVIITKITDRKVSQTEWNLDKCDGTGKSGFRLDLSKIQMAYIDYSWYGAGKVRFGFKDQHGVVKYVHEFVHGNFETEAYMRSGNMPARYELANKGAPTYVPALAHWGTSVIMDGRFDDDKAYVFTANSLTTTLLNQDADSSGDVTVTVTARAEDNDRYNTLIGRQYRKIGYALELSSTSPTFNSFAAGMSISGPHLAEGTELANPDDPDVFPQQPYIPSIESYEGDNNDNPRTSSKAIRDLLVINQRITAENQAEGQYSVTISTGSATNTNNDASLASITKDIPVISIRLAPSVDTNTPGSLGEREIINRMQLILNEVDILTTHGLEVELRLNGQLNSNQWARVENPSLSQLIYHGSSDTISGGTVVFSFNAQGSTGSDRTAVLTAKSLGEVATLGNSILGGDGTFPDGPDILTVVAKLKEDPSTVTVANPLSVQGRISWSESQA